MSKVSTSEFQKGMYIIFKDEPHQIVEFQHVNPGKGSAFVRAKLKSHKTSKVTEFTFKSGDQVELFEITTHEMQYLYKTDKDFVMMDNTSYEQVTLAKDIIGNFANFMKENETYQVMMHDGEAVGMRYPKKVRLLVTEAEEAAKGNTVIGGKKPVIVETGVQIMAPMFIKKGDIIAVDPETSEYQERLSMK